MLKFKHNHHIVWPPRAVALRSLALYIFSSNLTVVILTLFSFLYQIDILPVNSESV